MKRTLLIIAAGLALCLSASADIVAQWTFNDSDGVKQTGTLYPAIATGSGCVAAGVGSPVFDFNAASGSSDPAGASIDNNRWRMVGFPQQGTDNKTAGGQFTVDTTGYKDITMSWDQININVGSRYWRIQYSTDSGSTWVDKDVITNLAASAWQNPIATVNFASVTGANENPSFMVRLVAEWESTATGQGADAYVAVLAPSKTYDPAGANCGLDMVTFRGSVAAANLLILTNPVSQVVAVGQPASFNVSAGGGSGTITYQWRKNSATLDGATTTVYNIAAAQLADAGSYDVVVAQGSTTLTSTVATLTVRTPLNLAWTGQNGSTWDTSAVNWQNTSTLASAAFTGGDNVLFDSRGAAAPTVNLAGSLNPSSVTVNASSDYTFRSDVGGKLTGTVGLTKQGSGTLIVDTDNTYSGPTVIEAGVVQLGLADAHGSLGTGPITNNGALVFNRTDFVIVSNTITGSGSLTNSCTLTLSGANTFGGPLAVNANSLILSKPQTINSPDIVLTASTATGAAGATKFAVNGGQVVGAGTTIRMTGTTASPDCRTIFQSMSGTNYLNGPIVVEGNGSTGIQTEGANTLTVVNGNVSGPGYGGTLFLRGGGNANGIFNGTINLPGCNVHKADASTWTINSTGNAWNLTSFAQGILRLGAHNALPTALNLWISTSGNTATFDLAGFNQQIGNLTDTGGTAFVTNSSATANSTLSVSSGIYNGTLADSATRGKIGVTILGNTYFGGSIPYHGDTTVAGGTLYLTGGADLLNSPVIDLAGGGLDVSARTDGTLTVSAAQTLKGNETLAVTGNLVNNGTLELKVNKAGGIVSNDKLYVTGQLTCGGTLKLDLAGESLNCLDVIEIFGGYLAGDLPTIEPAVPAFGATWDTSTLLLDGRLRIHGPPVFTSTVLSGTSLILSGGGEASLAYATFSIVTSTDVAAPAATWTPVQTGSFDGGGSFSVPVPFTPGQPQRFYRLKTP